MEGGRHTVCNVYVHHIIVCVNIFCDTLQCNEVRGQM
jgi:hypothetical protein